jgi:predicted ATPase
VIHLRSIALDPNRALPDKFPFNVPVIQSLETVEFLTPITFFVGENGSGKSTLLELIGVAANLPTIGSEDSDFDDSLADVRLLTKHLKWVWSKRSRNGFFMRSEDFFGFAKRVGREMAAMKRTLDDEDEDNQAHKGQSKYARSLAKMPYASEYYAMRELYGDGLDAQSHGESYFELFRSRFRPSGLYLMDEPEAPLSPTRQLTLIAMLKEMITQDAQFIIATHSPILLAYPGATIYNFDDGRIQQSAYDTLEHVVVMRGFLENPDSYLRHLLE